MVFFEVTGLEDAQRVFGQIQSYHSDNLLICIVSWQPRVDNKKTRQMAIIVFIFG